MFRQAVCALFGLLTAFAQYPASVRNAAGFSTDVAPGSLAEIQLRPSDTSGGLPTLDPTATRVELNGVSIPVVGRGSSPVAVLVAIPRDTKPGTAQLTLASGSVTSLPVSITIVPSNFGLFNQAQNYTASGPELNQLTHAARPVQFVTIWGTGLGAATDAEVLVGGIRAEITYAGPAPGIAGVDQINFRIPQSADLPLSCYVAVQVRAGGRSSNVGSLAIAGDSNVCQHPYGLSAAQLANVDRGGTVPVGQVSLSTAIAPTTPGAQDSYSRSDSASASFLSYEASGLRLQIAPSVVAGAVSGCQPSLLIGSLISISPRGANVGDTVTLAAPREWFDKKLELAPAGPLYTATLPPAPATADPDAVPPSFFDPGTWTLSAPGSVEAQAFQATFDLPAAIRITNLDLLRIVDRAKDAAITWDGSSYSDADIISVGLNATSGGVSCRALASTGQLTIPSSLLTNLNGDAARLQVYVSRTADRLARFSVVLKDGTSMPGVVRYQSSELVTVTLR